MPLATNYSGKYHHRFLSFLSASETQTSNTLRNIDDHCNFNRKPKRRVGKTTTAVTLAHGLALRGKRALLLNFDPQGQAAPALHLPPSSAAYSLLTMDTGASEIAYIQGKIISTERENFWLLPGNKQTADVQAMINSQGKSISWVREALERFCAHQYHYLGLDTDPSLGGIQERVLWASDLVIVPTLAVALGSDGVCQVLETMKRLASEKG